MVKFVKDGSTLIPPEFSKCRYSMVVGCVHGIANPPAGNKLKIEPDCENVDARIAVGVTIPLSPGVTTGPVYVTPHFRVRPDVMLYVPAAKITVSLRDAPPI